MPHNPLLHNMIHTENPREKIMREIGDIGPKRFKLSGHQVLCAHYKRPEQTAGGLMLTNQTQKEDEYQGKVGLIVAMGPLAFGDLGPAWPDDITPKVGDFVFHKIMDGFIVQVNGYSCRIFEDRQIRGFVDDPDMVL